MNASGALLIDKFHGPSSFQVLRELKRKFDIAKIGHAGTLDPYATGLLVVLCGKATRLQSLFLESDKTYSGLIRFGLGTSTDDLEGEVIQEDTELSFLKHYSKEESVAQIIEEFSGTQQQVPPQFSAVKVQGKRSYALARKGEQTDLTPRKVNIYFNSLSWVSDTELRYEVCCSKGTYIRSLARDIGAYLNSCAVVAELRRTSSGCFLVDDAVSLDSVTDPESHLLPMERLAAELPEINVSEETYQRLMSGDQGPLAEVSKELGLNASKAALFSEGRFGGLVELTDRGWRIGFMC